MSTHANDPFHAYAFQKSVDREKEEVPIQFSWGKKKGTSNDKSSPHKYNDKHRKRGGRKNWSWTQLRHLPARPCPTGSANDRAGRDKGAVSFWWSTEKGRIPGRQGSSHRAAHLSVCAPQSKLQAAQLSDAGWKGVHTVGRANGIWEISATELGSHGTKLRVSIGCQLSQSGAPAELY